jgi:hypothetical protein
MKVDLYIEKKDFDQFFTWMNRIALGIYSTPRVKFSHRIDDIQDPLRVSLDTREYTLIRDVKRDIDKIQKTYGPMDLDFSPISTHSHLLIIGDVLREADRQDRSSEVVYTALQLMQQIPGVTPTEAMTIAEREWLVKGSPMQEKNI